jgi:hypothetical protein
MQRKKLFSPRSPSFSVPSAALIDSLNSVRVSVNVYDDGDGPNNETGDVVFVLNGIGQSNFVVTSFNNGLNGTTAASPLTVSDFVDPANFTNMLAEIKDDGIFFVRLNRTGGDYFVQRGSVTIDANVVPEPATLLLTAVRCHGHWNSRPRAAAWMYSHFRHL